MANRGATMQTDVLSVLRRNGGPLSAYDIIGELRGAYPKLAPPTIYRALSALIDQGCIHRLESLNAYVACQCDAHQNASIMSICDDCGTVDENVAPDVLSKLSSALDKKGFVPSRHVIEVHGLCATCGTAEVATQ